MTNIQKGYWAVVAISIFWGTTWFVSKLALVHLPPLQMTGIRQTVAGILMISFFIFKRKKLPAKEDLLFHLMAGFLLISCSNGLTTWAVKYIPSYLGALIGCLMPFVMIMANFFIYKEKIKKLALLGLLIGFGGVAVLMSSFYVEFSSPNFLFGIILSMIGVGTWTTGTLITVKNKRKLDPFEGIGWQMLFGGIILYIFSLITGQHVAFSSVPMMTWIQLLYLIGVGSIFCFICYLFALQHLPISLVTIYVYINPLVALLMGVFFLDEKITLSIVTGALTILLGIYIVKLASRPKA
jgi:drug/metabolite transporter (DMT)-like permease